MNGAYISLNLNQKAVMKFAFNLLLSCFVCLSAHAHFVGMEYEAVAETANGTTYRVYAVFDNPTDELVAVYALETSPMVVGVSTSFYQDAVGAVLAQTINPAFFGAFPSLQYDSWFTIGSEIPMAPVMCSKSAWTSTSRLSKTAEVSPWTPSLAVLCSAP